MVLAAGEVARVSVLVVATAFNFHTNSQIKLFSGILSAGQGTRFVLDIRMCKSTSLMSEASFILADTEQLHRKISEMSNRIRQLEDALAILQSTISDQRHTLLSDDLLKIKFGAEALRSQRSSSPGDDQDNPRQSIDATGTLTLGESGEVKYFGRSAGSEVFYSHWLC